MEAIDILLSSNPLTSQHLRNFKEQYPDVAVAAAVVDGEETPQVEVKDVWNLEVRASLVESDEASSFGTFMCEEAETRT